MNTNRFFSALILSLSIACTAFDEPVEPVGSTPTTRSAATEAALRASAGIANANNPYSVENMQKAAVQISKAYGTPPRPVYATHEYVRFLPKDSTQVETLEDVLKLELFSYPLDRFLSNDEIEFYSNDRINGFTWQYCVVPKNFQYPSGIRREVLQDAYLESGDNTFSPGTTGGGSSGGWGTTSNTWYDDVVTQSMKNAGITVIGGGSSSTGGTSPQAVIRYYDDATNSSIPLQGVKVRVSTLLNVGTGYTDQNGIVVIAKGSGGKFRNPVKYQIKFENNYWKIKNSIDQIATIEGPKTTDTWYCTITPSNKETSAYGAIHRALYHFYFKQNEVAKPKYTAKRLKIETLWDQNHPDYSGYFTPVRKIVIYGKYQTSVDYYDRYNIINTTFHELGHASHYMHKDKYNPSEEIVKQSYADAVAYYFLSELYPNKKILDNIKKKYHPESPNYTQIGESLFNQGVTLSQLQTAVLSGTSWKKWKEAVKASTSLEDWIVDLIFDYKEHTIEFDLLNSSIAHEINNFIVYQNQPARFSVQPVFSAMGAEIVNWSSSSPNFNIIQQTAKEVTVSFSQVGQFQLYCTIRLSNGKTFKTGHTVKVNSAPTITGPKSPRLGVSYSYELDDDNNLIGWDIGRYDSNGNFIITEPSTYVKFYVKNSYGLHIVFLTPGDYVVRAICLMDKTINIDYPVTVKAEGTRTGGGGNTPFAPGIYRVDAYRHNRNEDIKHLFWDRQFIPLQTEYERMELANSFMAYTADLPADHPYSGKFKFVFRHNSTNGTEAYSSGILYDTDHKTILSTGGSIAFYVLKEQVPGSVPLYAVDMVIENNGKTLSHYRYMSLVNVRDGENFETYGKTRYTNMGILGYVFPAENRN